MSMNSHAHQSQSTSPPHTPPSSDAQPSAAACSSANDDVTLENFYEKRDQVPKFWRDKYDRDANKYWNTFYQKNTANFFKDRHWLLREFPDLRTEPNRVPPLRVLEIGCGVGNSLFPLLEESPSAFVYGVDFAAKAIQLLQANPLFAANSPHRCAVAVCDISQSTPTPLLGAAERQYCDVATLVFVLSAIAPARMLAALRNVNRCLRTGGVLLFRDYASTDLAAERFQHRDQTEKKLGERFYVRGDGTQVYYFDVPTLEQLLRDAGFRVQQNDVRLVEHELVNHKTNEHMVRIFVQARVVKEREPE